jgi:hypothetical protein
MNRICQCVSCLAALLLVMAAARSDEHLLTSNTAGLKIELAVLHSHVAALDGSHARIIAINSGDEKSALADVRITDDKVAGIKIYYPYPPQYYGPYMVDTGLNEPFIIGFNQQMDMLLVWDPYRRVFEWQPVVPPRPGMGAPPMIIYGPGRPSQEIQAAPQAGSTAVPATRTLVGEAARVAPSATNPRISVQVNDIVRTYTVAKDAIVLRGLVGGRAAEVSLGEIRPGDQVTLRFDERGIVTSIRAQYRTISGRVKSAAEDTVLLESGRRLRVSQQTEVILPGNLRGSLRDIQAGDSVIASISPIAGRAYVLSLMTPLKKGQPASSPITLNAVGPFRSGDLLVVRFRGAPGGTAMLIVPGVAAPIRMTETRPGIYVAQYTVQPGDAAIRQPVTVRFTASDGATYNRQSRPITIRTIAGYLPRITSPVQGQQIVSPIVVKGIAEPGSIVRVTVQYRRDVQRVLPIEGLTAVQEVRADAEGRWSTQPLSAAGAFSDPGVEVPVDFGEADKFFQFPEEPSVIWTITATSIDPDGGETASYSVEVTKKEVRQIIGIRAPSVELSIMSLAG